jgi:hypothetical protein
VFGGYAAGFCPLFSSPLPAIELRPGFGSDPIVGGPPARGTDVPPGAGLGDVYGKDEPKALGGLLPVVAPADGWLAPEFALGANGFAAAKLGYPAPLGLLPYGFPLIFLLTCKPYVYGKS